MVPVAGAQEDPEVHRGVVGQYRGAVERLGRIEFAARGRIRLTRRRREEALAGPVRGRVGRHVELPELATRITDVHAVDVAVVVQVDGGRVLGDAEVHVLAVIRGSVVVV